MSNFSGLYDIRDMKETDKNFVISSFLRAVYNGESWFSLIPKEIFMREYHKVIMALVNGKAVVKIACPKTDPDVIIGYSILSLDYQGIIFTYVKKDWRLKGVARSLVPKYPTYVTHLTKTGKELLHKLPGCIFNPFQ